MSRCQERCDLIQVTIVRQPPDILFQAERLAQQQGRRDVQYILSSLQKALTAEVLESSGIFAEPIISTSEPVIMMDQAAQGADAMRWQPPEDPELTQYY